MSDRKNPRNKFVIENNKLPKKGRGNYRTQKKNTKQRHAILGDARAAETSTVGIRPVWRMKYLATFFFFFSVRAHGQVGKVTA